MEEKVKISPAELMVLTVFFTTGTTFLTIPSTMATEAKQDAWLSALVSIIICFGLAYFFILCGKSLGEKSYVQYLETVYGKIVGKIIGLSYVFFSFMGTSTLLSYFGFFTSTSILTNTPVEMMHIMVAILIIVVARAGLEVLARTGELIIIWVVLLLIALIIFLIPNIEFDRLRPLFEASITDHTRAIFAFITTAGFPLILLLMVFPKHLNRPDKAKWSFIVGSLIGTTIVAIVIILCLLVLGASTTARQMYPSYVLSKTISIFNIIERIEAIMASIWIISIFFKASIYFYTCVIALAQILEVKDHKVLAIPMGILAVIFATIVYPNTEYMIYWDNNYGGIYLAIMGGLIPLITLLIDKIKKRSKSKKAITNS